MFTKFLIAIVILAGLVALPFITGALDQRTEVHLYKNNASALRVVKKKRKYCGPVFFDEEVCKVFTDKFIMEVRLAEDARLEAERIALRIQNVDY